MAAEKDVPVIAFAEDVAASGGYWLALAADEIFAEDTSLLGSIGAGMAVFNFAMRWERALILAAAVGTMHRQLEQCLAYARERRQFGRSIGSFQAVSHRLVNMKLRLDILPRITAP